MTIYINLRFSSLALSYSIIYINIKKIANIYIRINFFKSFFNNIYKLYSIASFKIKFYKYYIIFKK